MNLRVHYGNFEANLDASDSAADSVLAFDLFAKDAPWESLQAAERAFNDAPHEFLDGDEIEIVLRWRSAGDRALPRGRRAGSARHRLRTEPLERRDTPTPLFAVHFLIASLAPPAAAWDDERSSTAALRQPIYIAVDRSGAAGLPLDGERSTTVRPGETQQISATASAANDWAIVELLAASAPSSRSLEPLGCCA